MVAAVKRGRDADVAGARIAETSPAALPASANAIPAAREQRLARQPLRQDDSIDKPLAQSAANVATGRGNSSKQQLKLEEKQRRSGAAVRSTAEGGSLEAIAFQGDEILKYTLVCHNLRLTSARPSYQTPSQQTIA